MLVLLGSMFCFDCLVNEKSCYFFHFASFDFRIRFVLFSDLQKYCFSLDFSS